MNMQNYITELIYSPNQIIILIKKNIKYKIYTYLIKILKSIILYPYYIHPNA